MMLLLWIHLLMEEEPLGEVWQFEENIEGLVKICQQILSDEPLFFLINSYTTGISSTVLANILKMQIQYKGNITNGEIGLPMRNCDMLLPC